MTLTNKIVDQRLLGRAIKLTNQIVDQRLDGTNIKRIGDYISANTHILFQCLIKDCNHIWQAKPSNIFTGYGCPECAGNSRLTNEKIDIQLKERPIKRLGDCINAKTHITFQCLVQDCHNIWSAQPTNILSGKGCPECAGNSKLTNEEIDKRLIGRDLKRIDNYINSYTLIKFRCLVKDCNHIWSVIPNSILRGRGCPNCFGNLLLTNVEIDKRLEGRNIKRIDNYINSSTPIEFGCLICSHTWNTTPNSIVNNNSGCSQCNLPGANEKYLSKQLKQTNISFKHNFNIKKINIRETHNYSVDFYFSQFNLIIEYNGTQHYQPVCFNGISQERAQEKFLKQQNRDQYIRKFCADNNLTLIEIDGRIYKNKKLEIYVLELLKNQCTNTQ